MCAPYHAVCVCLGGWYGVCNEAGGCDTDVDVDIDVCPSTIDVTYLSMICLVCYMYVGKPNITVCYLGEGACSEVCECSICILYSMVL